MATDAWPVWTLTDDERALLDASLDALLPPEGSFPAPSDTGIINDFILKRVPPAGVLAGPLPYPGIDSDALRQTLSMLDNHGGRDDMTAALERLEREQPLLFGALWRLATYGYYSRPETIAAIQQDLTPAYHGAPLPLGYAHAIEPWDPTDPFQLPTNPRGTYVPTEEVTRVDLSQIIPDAMKDSSPYYVSAECDPF